MSRDPRHHVLPGDPLRLAAEQVNALNQMMRARPGTSSGPLTKPDFAQLTVLVRNTSGLLVPRLGVMGVSAPHIEVSGDNPVQFLEQMILNGVLPEGGDQPVGVAVEPIPSGAIGRVAVSGRFPCKLKVLAANHKFARGRAGDVTQLITADCGPFRVVWMQPGVSDGAFAAVIG